jgi:hypothetical protein
MHKPVLCGSLRSATKVYIQYSGWHFYLYSEREFFKNHSF